MSVLVAGCLCSGGSPPSADDQPSLDNLTLYANRPVTDAAVGKADSVVASASKALKEGNGDAFVALLAKGERERVGKGGDWKGKDAADLGDALGRAKLVDKSADLMVYEVELGGVKRDYFVRLEGTEWKIDGL